MDAVWLPGSRVHVALSLFGFVERRTAKYENRFEVLSAQSSTTLLPLAFAVRFFGVTAAPAVEQNISSPAHAAASPIGRKEILPEG